MSVFGDWAGVFHEAKINVIPVEGKGRGAPEGWDKYYREAVSDVTHKEWVNSKSDKNIAMVCGPSSGIVAVDIDTTDERLRDIIEACLPSPRISAKVGKKGVTYFFQWDESLAALGCVERMSTEVKVGDLIFSGLVIMPPSIHPETTNPYFWEGAPVYEVKEMLLPFTYQDAISVISAVKTFLNINPQQKAVSLGNQGRNDTIKREIGRLLNIHPSNEVVDLILEFDQKTHPTDPLFQDRHEYPSHKPGRPKAEAFVKSMIKTVVKKADKIPEYPNEETGFFERIELKNGHRWEPSPYELAAFLKDKYYITNTNSHWLTFDKTHYKNVEPNEIKKLIIKLTKERPTLRQLNEFYGILQAQNFRRSDEIKSPDGCLNLQNGILNIKTRELAPHTPDVYFRYALPHQYDPNAECNNWTKFLYETFDYNSQLVDLAQEIFGYVISGGDPWLHKAFVLLGSGRNGKSTFLDVLKFILGRENCSAVPIQNLNKPFSVVMADGKLANIVGDASSKEIESDAFKTAVGGEELVAAQKGMPEYAMTFKAKIIFAMNRNPFMRDPTAGAYEKLCFIPFNRYLKESERIPDFARNHLFPEASGIINWALAGHDRLIERKSLPVVDAVDEMNEVYRIESNPIHAWLCERDLEFGRFYSVKLGDMFSGFDSWCKANNIMTQYSKIGFSRGLSEVLKSLGSKQNQYLHQKREKTGIIIQGVNIK